MHIAKPFPHDQPEAVAGAPVTSGNEIGPYHHNDNEDDHRDRSEAPFDDGAPFQPDDAATRLALAAQRLAAAAIAVRRCLDHGDLDNAGGLRGALREVTRRIGAEDAPSDDLAYRLFVLADRQRQSTYPEHGLDTLAS